MDFYDNTRCSAYNKCPRLYYLRHVRGWRSEGTSAALVFGSSWHAAMDVLWPLLVRGDRPQDILEPAMMAFLIKWESEGFDPMPSLEQTEKLGARTPGNAGDMMLAYCEERSALAQNCELISIEQPFIVPLWPDDTESWYCGRLDKVLSTGRETVVLEHKTTTEYKIDGGFKTQYLTSWDPAPQIDGYLYGGALTYGNVRQVWIDAALVHKKARAFKVIPISKGPPLLDSWLEETRATVNDILRDLQWLTSEDWEGKPTLLPFRRKTSACHEGKYGPCTFTGICSTWANPEQLSEPPGGFIYDPWSPFDELQLANLEALRGVENAKRT